MTNEILHSHDLCFKIIHRLVDDLADEQMTWQDKSNVNHAAWTVGHLVCVYRNLARRLGEEIQLEPVYDRFFAMGTEPHCADAGYPTKTALLTTFDTIAAAVADKVRTMDEKTFNTELQEKGIYKTVGEAVVFVMTAHLAIHLGQLSAWRRALDGKTWGKV